jgi:putative ubiquitin-RnfH superfamily antitoxin RatB of RatAB toxin-antitoxin module
MDRDDGLQPLQIAVAYSPTAGAVDEVALSLPAGATLRQAVEASGLLQRHPAIDLEQQRVGVWGKFKSLETPLRDRDRVEIYRPLKVDPKQARRERYRKQRVARESG